MNDDRFHTQPDETVILKVRKHWFVLLQSTLGTIIATFAPIIFFSVAMRTGSIPPSFTPPALVGFCYVLWLLIAWMALCIAWTVYYLDAWIVTDRRIVNIEQRALFKRDITSWRMERVQEVTIHIHDIIETLLGFGTIEVETAGPSVQFAKMEGIPHPERVQNAIMRQVDCFTERHNHIHQASDRVAHDVHAE